MNIVNLSSDQPVTTTFAIAEGTKVEHRAVNQLARTYLVDLEELGRIEFKIKPFRTAGRTQHRTIAVLNVQQSTLLMSYMRNNEVVREFEKRLVKEFWAMSQKMRQQAQNPANLLRLQLIEMAMQAEQKRNQLENKVEELSPKADALNRAASTATDPFEARELAIRDDMEKARRLQDRIDAVTSFMKHFFETVVDHEIAMKRFIELNPGFNELRGSNSLLARVQKVADLTKRSRTKLEIYSEQDRGIHRFKIELKPQPRFFPE